MKRERPFNCIAALLLSLGLAAWGIDTASAQDAVYAARAYGNNTSFAAPFYCIDNGRGFSWGTSGSQSSATNPVVTPGRPGSWYHTVGELSAGEGYGLVHSGGSQAGAVYEVQVTQPLYKLNTDLIMNVGSTNCDIGSVFGATAAGGWTNTTAFQAPYCVNQWTTVCYLTNRSGVTRPHVDFKYASGSNHTDADHTFADCVRFHLVNALRLTGISSNSVTYSGGTGARFVLLKSSSLGSLGGWDRVATNAATPGSFTIPAVGTERSVFYAIASE